MNGPTRMVGAQTSTGDRRDDPRQLSGPQTSEAGLPAQRGKQQDWSSGAILVADPGRESRQTLTQGLLAGGLARVLVADSAAQVDDLIAGGQRGQLALISLAFGTAATRLIDELLRGSWTSVIALAPTPDPVAVVAALQAGACGVLRGHPIPPSAATQSVEQVRQLSEREVEVLASVAEGRSNQWIGEHLSLSALTVKSHLARISRKLGTGDRAHMVAIAMRAGLLR